jgi:NitT/TauT family transport system ATP-binding protein
LKRLKKKATRDLLKVKENPEFARIATTLWNDLSGEVRAPQAQSAPPLRVVNQ